MKLLIFLSSRNIKISTLPTRTPISLIGNQFHHRPSFTLTPSYLYNTTTQKLRFENTYTKILTLTCQISMLICLWQHMLTNITTHSKKKYCKSVHINIYEGTHQSYTFYLNFSLVNVGLGKLCKVRIRKKKSLYSCTKRKEDLDLHPDDISVKNSENT